MTNLTDTTPLDINIGQLKRLIENHEFNARVAWDHRHQSYVDFESFPDLTPFIKQKGEKNHICVQTGEPCGMPCYPKCPVYNNEDPAISAESFYQRNGHLPSTNRQPSQEQPEGKSAEEMVRDAVAIYGMDTVEAPLASIIELMESYASQPSRPELTVWPTNEDIAKIVSGFPNTSTRIMAIDLSNWLKTQVRAVDLEEVLNEAILSYVANEDMRSLSETEKAVLIFVTQFLKDRKGVEGGK